VSKAVLVISFEDEDPVRLMNKIDEFRTTIHSPRNVKFYIGIRETADQVLDIFKDLEE